jgi:CRISPR-associated exonuclease Cas4
MEPELIPIASLQHYAYCPRQCALAYMEQLWQDNFFSADGLRLHARIDSREPETRKGIKYERSVAVKSNKLGLTGKLDLLEINLANKQLTPVEYKRGNPKLENWDRVQLCAQVLCLEEMLNTNITQAYLWYWQSRERINVAIDENLRNETITTINDTRRLFESKITPTKVADKKRCRACSLKDLCNPDWLRKDHSLDYINQLFKE